MKLVFIVLFTTSLFAAPIKGKLYAETKCLKEDTGQLFIAAKSKLIYQIELPPRGSFQADLPAGEYRVSYIMKNGCSANQTITHKNKAQSMGLKVRK